MRTNLHKLFAVLILVFGLKISVFSQAPQLTIPNYSACPCQTINLTSTWNNVSSITYTLYGPGVPPVTFASNTFSLFNCTATFSVVTYTLVGAGTYTTAPITNTVIFTYTVVPPAPMVIGNQANYCYGDNAVLTAPIGGTVYNIMPGNLNMFSNVITINNLTSSSAGVYTITSVIGGCTVTGSTPINVSPNTPITINSASNVCQGGSVNLTSFLTSGANYQWYDNYNTPIGTFGNASTILTNLQVSQSGTYKVTADLQFAGLFCPHTATTTINVVQTNPVNTSASPANIVCQGVNLSLSANAGGATGFTWSGPQSFASNLANPVISPAIPANGGNYTATALFVTSFLTCSTSAVINVSVVPVSIPVINMPSSVCQGTSFTLIATAGSNPINFTWAGPAFPGGGVTTSPGSPFQVNNAQPSASGTQFVTAKFAILSTQCVSTSSAQLNVVPVNTVSVIPPGPICTPNNAFLQALATGANLYTWVGPNGFSTPGANVYVYYPTPAASGIYTVTAYFGSGSSLVCTNTNTLQLSVYPVLQFSLVPRQQACYNTPITITGPPGATSYTWTSSTGFTSNSKDITFPSAQPNNSGTYTLNISLGPCNSSGSSEVVILNPIQFTLTPQNRTICSGDTIVLEGGAAGGSQNYAYMWNPAIYLESNNGPKQTAVPLGSVQYNLIVHDVACPNYTISHAFEVNVKQPPLPKMTLTKNESCQPLCQFYNTGTQKESFVTTYDFGGNLVFQKDSFAYCLNEPGTYTLHIYSKGKNGCSGMYEYPYPLIVKPKPGSGFTWSPDVPSTIDAITFVPSSKNGPIIHRNWTFLGGIIPGDTSKTVQAGLADTTNVENPVRLYEYYDTYPVLLSQTNEQACTDSVLIYVKVIDNMQIFVPNTFTPNDDGINDVFIAKGTGMKSENYSMEIFNRAGLLVFSTKDITEAWDGKVKGQVVKDAVYIYKIKVVGMNGEGRKEISGYVTVLK